MKQNGSKGDENVAKYSIQTFEENLSRSRAKDYEKKLGNPNVCHDSYGVVFLRYDSKSQMNSYLAKAKKLLGWAVPVVEYGDKK